MSTHHKKSRAADLSVQVDNFPLTKATYELLAAQQPLLAERQQASAQVDDASLMMMRLSQQDRRSAANAF